jgi:hypothetical protein
MTDGTSREIAAEEASIKTASVELKTITVNNKQMTLAVFRQVPEEDLLDKNNGEMRGIPWGWVNYHIDCPKDPEASYVDHLHVLWQKGQTLKRSAVRLKPDERDSHGALEEGLRKVILMRALSEGYKPEAITGSPDGNQVVRCKIEEVTVQVWIWSEVTGIWSTSDYSQSRGKREAMKYLIQAGLADTDGTVGDWKSMLEIARAVALQLKTLRANWAANVLRLQSLDQLYIAV